MKKVCVIGCPGSGKSTLTQLLSERLGLPSIHLDKIWWRPGWVEPDVNEFEQRLARAMEQPGWVMDGNFADFLHLRLPQTDTIVWLDYPLWLCLFRVLKRWLMYRGQVRQDMGAGCPEQWDWSFILFVVKFRRDYRPRIIEALKDWDGEVLRFTRSRDAASWLAGL